MGLHFVAAHGAGGTGEKAMYRKVNLQVSAGGRVSMGLHVRGLVGMSVGMCAWARMSESLWVWVLACVHGLAYQEACGYGCWHVCMGLHVRKFVGMGVGMCACTLVPLDESMCFTHAECHAYTRWAFRLKEVDLELGLFPGPVSILRDVLLVPCSKTVSACTAWHAQRHRACLQQHSPYAHKLQQLCTDSQNQ